MNDDSAIFFTHLHCVHYHNVSISQRESASVFNGVIKKIALAKAKGLERKSSILIQYSDPSVCF